MADIAECGSGRTITIYGILFFTTDFKEAFAMFDKDGDGEISIKELTTVMRSLGLNPTESEIVEIMANLDLDGTYIVCYVEFQEISGNIFIILCRGRLSLQTAYHVIL